ncbi:MAG: beta-lactamase superfamily II metal-dependent hydrolase [Francisellaceae bacterium]|jgi:beta-lactamase superfamily II metal-dependent hydrolase
MIKVKMYPACEGDAFLISFGEHQETNIIIDMGLTETYRDFIRKDLIDLKEQGRRIDLLVITHVDQDHIQGAISFIEENGPEQKIIEVVEIWHNSYRHLQFEKEKTQITANELIALNQIKQQNVFSDANGQTDISIEQGSTLASLLYANYPQWNTSFNNKAVCLENNFKNPLKNVEIKLLSPDKDKLNKLSKLWLNFLEDNIYEFNLSDDEIFDDAYELYIQSNEPVDFETSDASYSNKSFNIEDFNLTNGRDNSKTNGSSISFILEYMGKKLLFLGDAHKDIIIRELTLLSEQGYELYFDLVKVSHHGSKNNISSELLQLISSKRYLVSTNGARHKHPDIEAIAEIAKAKHVKEIYTNYDHTKLTELNNEKLESQYNYKIIHCDNFLIAKGI